MADYVIYSSPPEYLQRLCPYPNTEDTNLTFASTGCDPYESYCVIVFRFSLIQDPLYRIPTY